MHCQHMVPNACKEGEWVLRARGITTRAGQLGDNRTGFDEPRTVPAQERAIHEQAILVSGDVDTRGMLRITPPLSMDGIRSLV